jgi:hypothetical protein
VVLVSEKTGLLSRVAGVWIPVWLLLVAAQTVAAAGFSMGCVDRPAHSESQNRGGVPADRGAPGRSIYRRPAWAGGEPSQAGRTQPPGYPRFFRTTPETGTGPKPPAEGFQPPRQPEWVERLYEKFPVHSGAEMAHRSSDRGGSAR